MSINASSTAVQTQPLTRADVEKLLQILGSSDKLNLSNQVLHDIDLSNLVLLGANLRGADLKEVNLREANLREADLSRANLSRADLSGAILSRADLNGAILSRAILNKTDLSRANLIGTILIGTILSGANLRETDLSGANLREANLREAALIGADLREADLSGANLRGADLREADLSGANLRGADLIGANLSEAHLRGTILRGADLSGAILLLADLSKADLSKANLSKANLRGTNLSGTILLLANMSNVRGIDIQGKSVPEDISTFRIFVMEEPLTSHNLITIFSAITDISTKCWLIAHRRFADLIEYTQTHDVRFVEETKLSITRMTYSSLFEGSFNIDMSVKNVIAGIGAAIDGVAQARVRLEKAELANKEALFELERKELANERERPRILDKRIDVQKKGIEYALEIASKTIVVLNPNVNEQTKAKLMQALLPTILQLQNGKGLELVLPSPQNIIAEQN
ncbi:MAG TPA: pentapeptide repeat-containing protein [Ktedonobacteraceae bacterium]|nr:pentapeptide repeat-containing protein [Ktedonobacteraceae bacterium]